jgi:2-dehydro-3-deoxyphosphogluconate aldolase / (4S)-4-hydroxy-2-oxoglutarate aldolase
MIDLLHVLRSRRVVAVLRAPDADRFLPASQALYDAGITCLEFTLTTQGALDALRNARKALPEDALLGVGTVRTVQHVHDSIDAGADFLVNQAFKPELVDAAQNRDVPFVPGTLTPIEVVRAWEHGVPAVKVSPIGPVGGLDYLSELRGPLPEIPLMPTGGVTREAAPEYLRGGAVAVGLSRDLLLDALRPGGDLGALAVRARAVVAAISEV